MGGFLPLIEAFLAFVLTMLALTTAVSAIVGFILRCLRSRAYGLREMVDYLYRNDILLILKDLKEMYSGPTQVPGNLVEFLDESVVQRHKCRIDFLVDMTFLPTVIEGSSRVREEIIECTEGVGEDQPWRGKFTAWIDRDAKWFNRPLKWACRLLVGLRRWMRIRRSLKYGLDTLAEEEFVIRLKNSRFGKALATSSSAEKLDWYVNNLKELFNSIGKAYSEKFARSCRVLTVIVGFMLAFAANIDSLALIDTFITSPEIRNQIIEQHRDILNQKPSNEEDASPNKPDVKIKELGNKIGDKIKLLEDNVKALSLDNKERDDFKNLLSELEQSRADIQAAFNEANDAYNDIRRIVIGVTQNFPVGWSLYPNCGESDDPRCLRYKKMLQPKITTDHKEPSSFVCVDYHLSFSESTKKKWLIGWIARQFDGVGFNFPYVDVCRSDTAQYWRWLTGVLLTGLLLGLGTPFWIQVVTSFLRARNLIRGSGAESEKSKKDKIETETESSKPFAAGSSVETDIPKADTTGRRRLLT